MAWSRFTLKANNVELPLGGVTVETVCRTGVNQVDIIIAFRPAGLVSGSASEPYAIWETCREYEGEAEWQGWRKKPYGWSSSITGGTSYKGSER